MHGFAINCSNELTAFGNFIPCGITDAGVTTISQVTGRNISPADIVETVEQELLRHADRLAASFDVESPRDTTDQETV